MMLLLSSLHAESFEDKSTQELLAIVDYVEKSKEDELKSELKKRYQDMSKNEKDIYHKKIEPKE